MLMLRGLIGGLVQVGLIGAMLLVPAGTWNWPRALQFLAVYVVLNTVAIVTLARLAPASLEARLQAPVDKSQPVADRIATALLLVSLFVWFVFIPIDVFRLQLLASPSLAVSIFGVAVWLAGYATIWTTLFQNAFAAPIVKDQSDRGQVLIDSGPYRFVRHPFYLGFLLFLAGLALWLGSYAAVLAMVVPFVLFVARIRIEERTLRETLDGYDEYTGRVRSRLIPFVW